ncbi:hypothetical protein GOV09_04075 [Candidatus Woesearchaeota archaeon]|nr:hypothetical protein [Candidatus Woesearchaeota archaeon]
MLYPEPRKVVIYAAVIGTTLLVSFLTLLKARSGITGYVIRETTTDQIGLFVVFLAIAFVAAGMFVLSSLYKRYHRY